MPLSNYLPSSRLIQSGVCTSTTRPASPYEGQAIYETDTDKVLVWNGSAWVYVATSTVNPVGLELVKTQTVGSAVSSVVVSDVFSSTYDNYQVIVEGVDASTADQVGLIAFGSLTTGYYGSSYFDNSNGASTGTVRRHNAASLYIAVFGAADDTWLSMDIYSPYASRKTAMSGTYHGGGFSGWFGGQVSSTTSCTGFTLTAGSGTWTGGTITVYGYRK